MIRIDKIKVIVVDDSAFMRKAISDMIESEKNFEVIAKLRDGRELIEKVDQLNPDIITLDLHMKYLNGLETLKELKRLEKSYPVIMLSSATTEGSELTLECLDNGAISFITKPSGHISLDIEKVRENLVEQIKSIISNTKATKRPVVLNTRNRKLTQDTTIQESNIILNLRNKKIDAVVIGASTGGPKALQRVLTELPSNLGVPVLVVQHMPKGFTKVFADRLDKICNMSVVEAEEGMLINKGKIYIAKGGYHMTITTKGTIHLNEEPPIWGVRPAVDKLFDSAIELYKANLLSVILTGMGRDGANGTVHVKDYGGITISEDKSTCAIYGMPKAAFETGKVDLVIPLDQVADKIIKIVKGL